MTLNMLWLKSRLAGLFRIAGDAGRLVARALAAREMVVAVVEEAVAATDDIVEDIAPENNDDTRPAEMRKRAELGRLPCRCPCYSPSAF